MRKLGIIALSLVSFITTSIIVWLLFIIGRQQDGTQPTQSSGFDRYEADDDVIPVDIPPVPGAIRGGDDGEKGGASEDGTADTDENVPDSPLQGVDLAWATAVLKQAAVNAGGRVNVVATLTASQHRELVHSLGLRTTARSFDHEVIFYFMLTSVDSFIETVITKLLSAGASHVSFVAHEGNPGAPSGFNVLNLTYSHAANEIRLVVDSETDSLYATMIR